jgi:hypothetical protein
MRARPTIPRVRVALAATAGLFLITAVPASATAPSPLVEVVPSPPREPSPFSVADEFCTHDSGKPPSGHLASAPGVTPRSVTVAFVTPPAQTGAVTDPSASPLADPGTVARAFGQLANQCGGVSGRTLDVKVIHQTGDPATDCARVDAVHAFVAVAATPFAAAPCVAVERRTVVVATGDQAANSVLRSAQGRLAVVGGTDGRLTAPVLDLVESGRLDHQRVSVVAVHGDAADAEATHDLLAAADPSHRITVGGSVADAPSPPYDAVVATSFDPSLAALAHTGPRPVAVYVLGDTVESSLRSLPADAGRVGAQPGGGSNVYGWIAPDVASYRAGGTPTTFATMCNREYVRAVTPTATSSSTTTTTTVPPTVPGGAFAQIADACLAWRVTLRALEQAGPEPTQRSLVRALYRLPYVDNAVGGPDARPNQVVNEPLTRAGLPVFLAEAESPCRLPAPDRIVSDPGPCWVPVPGWQNGHAVNAPIDPEPQAGAPTPRS